MKLELFGETFCVSKLREIPNRETLAEMKRGGVVFLGVTEDEISLVAEESLLPECAANRESGFRAFRIAGNLEFSVVGILAELTAILANEGIPVFAVSTFDTDYLLLKEEFLKKARAALEAAGHEIEFRETRRTRER